jgi:hypothetical protein
LNFTIALWVFFDARSRKMDLSLLWAIGTALLMIFVIPFYLATRPLKDGEVREGGTSWNVIKSFALFWTLLMFVAGVSGMMVASNFFNRTDSGAEQFGAAIGTAIGMGMIIGLWFAVMVCALVIGLFLKKSSIVEKGPTGALALNVDVSPMSRPLKVYLAVILVVGILGILAAIAIPQYTAYKNRAAIQESSSVPSAPSASDNTFKGYTFNDYTLNDRERSVLKATLIMDFNNYINGKDSILSPIWQQHFNAINVTADQLQSDYESNEVAGDQKYKGKVLLISGVVTSINRSIGKNEYISLEGGSNMFIHPQARMYEGHENYLADLQKGQTITLACKGDGMLMGSAVVSQCVPINNFIEALVSVNIAMGEIAKPFSEGRNAVQLFVVMAIAEASVLQESSYCYGTNFGRDSDQYDKCSAEIINIFNEKKIDSSALKVVADKLKLDFSKIKGKPTEAANSDLASKNKKLAMGNQPSVPPTEKTITDGRFTAYNNGVVLDIHTNLMWAAKDNGSDINWTDAKAYCENYRGGGYKDWRMPTQDELAGLYDSTVINNNSTTGKCSGGYHLTNLINLTCGVPWASETRGSGAASFNFSNGKRLLDLQSGSGSRRVIPVRSGK